MDLLFYSFIVQILTIPLTAFFKENTRASGVSHFLLTASLVLGFSSSFNALISGTGGVQDISFAGVPLPFIRIDALGLYFLAIIQLVAVPTTIYSFSYIKHYIAEGRKIRSYLVFYGALLTSTQLIVIANHAVFFLVCWELMSTSAYLGMIFQKEKKEVQNGSFYYLIISHVAAFILYVFFFLLHHEAHSWYFSDFFISTKNGNSYIWIYLLGLAGFGMKAGFMPFHFWLPRAHPIAPTVFSAFLSGIIIKTGIYGILRTVQFLPGSPEWLGWLVLAVSLVSAIFGVWYALAQHDIKRLLAYHSVENIGIIGIGIGLGMIGSAYNSVTIQVLGFGGALLHTLNHAIFKSLLFIGSGVIYENFGTRNIELMGGIVKRARYFVVLFIIGSVAISGIPPFNGFISEFIIYNGFFSTARELHNYYPLIMLISAVGLAFVGGLAVACFTKINSIMFLGTERSEIKTFHVSVFDYISLSILALLCIIIGIYPLPFVGIVNKVINHAFINTGSVPGLFIINWSFISLVFIILALMGCLFYLWKKNRQSKYGSKVSPSWGCGYEDLNTRMQYTASSYADELNEISKSFLGYKKTLQTPADIFPVKGHIHTHSGDVVDNNFILPGYRKFSRFIYNINFLSHTDIRYYISFILIIIIIYSLIAFLWI